MLLIACVFAPNKVTVFADESDGTPTISIENLDLQQEYDQKDYLDIDSTDIELSDNVDSDETLRKTLSIKLFLIVSEGNSREILNTAQSEGFYSFWLQYAGDYTLEISVQDSDGKVATRKWQFSVIDSSVINAKYENGGKFIEPNDFGNEALYSALLKYIEDYASKKGDKFTGTTLTDTMFLQPDIKELILDGSGVSSISGLAKLKLEHVETLSITGGSITSISAEDFDGFISDTDAFGTEIKLKNINFAKNNISSFELPSLRSLTSLNLSSNNLTSLDLSGCWGDEVEINLSANEIESLDNISMPRADKITLTMINNRLYDIDEAYFNDSKYFLKIGAQGAVSSTQATTLDTTNGLRYYKSYIDGLKLEIYDASLRKLPLVKTIDDSDVMSGNYINIDLPVGQYVYKYVLNGANAFDKSDPDKCYYVTRSFNINPTAPTFKYEYKGKIYDDLDKVTGTVKLHLYSADLENGMDCKIMYKVDGGDWVEGNEVECSTGGTFSVGMKVVCGKYESKTTSVLVRTSLNTVIPDIVMFFIVLFVGLVIFAVIMPIVSKKFFRK